MNISKSEGKALYSTYFDVIMRSNGSKFIRVTDDNLLVFMRELHLTIFDALPNDWIYEVTMNAFEELEKDNLEDITIEADCYNHELLAWMNNSFAHAYCNEALEIGGPYTDIYDIISTAQHFAKERIYQAVHEFMQEQEESAA